MKRNIFKTLTVMGMLLFAMEAWATPTVDIIKKLNGTVNNDAGTVTSSISEGKCTLTVTPASGNYVTSEFIYVYSTVTGDMAHGRTRNLDLDNDRIPVTCTTPDASPSDETKYTFDMPEDGSNAEVTVNFQGCKALTSTMVSDIAAQTFTGEALTPAVTVTDGDVLTKDTHYTVEYSDNVNAGTNTAKATITGIGIYTGSVDKYFTINPKSITTATVSVDATQTYTYTGAAITPSATVTIMLTDGAAAATTLNAGTDYTITGYANNTNAATASSANAPTVTITGTGNFTGTASGTFTIAQAKLSAVTIAAIADQTYTGYQITPAVTVTISGNAVSTDEYNVVYGDNITVGENAGTVTLTSKNKNFVTSTDADATTKKTATFTIVAKTLTSAMVSDIAAQTYAGTALTPTVTVTDGDALTEGTHYTVEYSNNVNASTNTAKATITGKGNYSGSIDKFFTINKATLTVTPDDKTCNVGEAIPTLTVQYSGFVNGENESVLTKEPSASCSEADNNTPGIYTITASGGEATNYEFDYKTGTLTINQTLGITFDDNQTWATYYATENLAVPDGLKAYIVTDVDKTEGTVTTSQVTYLPKNEPVLLEKTGTSSTGFVAAPYTGATTTITNNLLLGSASAVDVNDITGGTVYVLYYNVFKRATSGTIPARRAYLVVSDAAPARLNIVYGGDDTGINNIRMDEPNDSWYTIDGRKLNGQPQRTGLYIRNGKKVFKR